MPSLTDLARDERSARRLLSFVVTPNDEVTGRLLGRLGAEDVVALADSDRSIPGMDRAEAAVWRDRIHARYRVDQLSAILTESGGFRFLIPSDHECRYLCRASATAPPMAFGRTAVQICFVAIRVRESRLPERAQPLATELSSRRRSQATSLGMAE